MAAWRERNETERYEVPDQPDVLYCDGEVPEKLLKEFFLRKHARKDRKRGNEAKTHHSQALPILGLKEDLERRGKTTGEAALRSKKKTAGGEKRRRRQRAMFRENLDSGRLS